MTRRCTGRSVLSLVSLLWLVACGGSEFHGDEGASSGSGGTAGGSGGTSSDVGGSGGSDASSSGNTDASSSGGRTATSSSGSGGASSGSGGTGGSAATGGSTATGGTGGSTVRGQCDSVDACLAAADFGDPCYSEGCSLPVAVSEADLENDSCLVPWARRGDGRPASCSVSSEPVACPESCAMPPQCIEVGCHNAECQLDFGYDDETCAGSGGSGGTSGSGGTTSTGGTGGTGGTGAECDVLNAERQEALNDAVSCNPEIDVPQCTGARTVPDQCGCPTLVNDYDDEAVSAAQEAYNVWVEAGCGPYPCGAACFYGEQGDCNEGTAICSWLGLN